MSRSGSEELESWAASFVSAQPHFTTSVMGLENPRRPASTRFCPSVQTITNMVDMGWHFMLGKRCGKTLMAQKLICLERSRRD